MTEAPTGGPLHAVHDALGARFGEVSGRRVPRNYGDPAAEYEAARDRAVVVDRSGRAAVRVHGRDPVRMIHGLAGADVEAVDGSRGAYSVLLTPKGKMVADFRVFRRGDELLLDLDPEALPGLLEHFRKYIPPLFARFEVLDDRVVLGVYGPEARSVVASALGVDLPADLPEEATVWLDRDDADEAVAPAAAGVVVRTGYAGVDGYDVLLPAGDGAGAWQALVDAGAEPAGHATLEVLRIEAGRPRWGTELTGAVIPLEAGLGERAISETKGCYTGQEVIVRILHRGHVNRHLRRLELGDRPAPCPGTELFRGEDGKGMGHITSSCHSPAAGQTVALGYVRREIEPPGTVRLGAPDGPEIRVTAL